MCDIQFSIMKLFLSITTIFICLVSCGQKSTSYVNTSIVADSTVDNQIIFGDLARSIDSLLQDQVNIGFSGAISVIVEGKHILQKGYGWSDSLKTTLVDTQTGFYLASTTKGITGVAALIAKEKGLFNTTDSLSEIYDVILNEYKDITIKEMLTHTAGLSNEYETYGATQRQENLQLIFSRPLGEKGEFNYTGAGFWLTAILIEESIQKPYEEFIKDNIFRIANMNNTHFWFNKKENGSYNYAQKLESFPPNGIEPNWGFRASSGIITDIVDLTSYFTTLTSGKLIKQDSLDELWGPHITLNSGIGIGYGWFTSNTSRGTTEIWSRGGEYFGHNSAIRWFKEENVAILILTNCGRLNGEEIEANRTISNKIEKLIFEKANNTK
jgi:CubicO group peptidase (beta-lactamase class C family)